MTRETSNRLLLVIGLALLMMAGVALPLRVTRALQPADVPAEQPSVLRAMAVFTTVLPPSPTPTPTVTLTQTLEPTDAITPTDSTEVTTPTETLSPTELKVIKDGTNITEGDFCIDLRDGIGRPFAIGSHLSLAGWMDGKIDEVRVSNTIRSNNWIATSHETQNDPANFMSWGSEEDQGGDIPLIGRAKHKTLQEEQYNSKPSQEEKYRSKTSQEEKYDITRID